MTQRPTEPIYRVVCRSCVWAYVTTDQDDAHRERERHNRPTGTARPPTGHRALVLASFEVLPSGDFIPLEEA